MDQAKLFSAFLSGVYKSIFEKDAEITVTFLKEQLFSNSSISIEGRKYVTLIL